MEATGAAETRSTSAGPVTLVPDIPGPPLAGPGGPRSLRARAADRVARDWGTARSTTSDRAGLGVEDARSFRQALVGWARGYALDCRQTPGPKPTIVEAARALRLWSTGYWTSRPSR
jgi:hypothetical protein